MIDYMIIGIVTLMILMAVIYISREKKKGVTCIGCPSAGKCASQQKHTEHCGCNCK